ncbi:MAG: ABC transporter permease [Nitrospirae bacterium]|nr:ABC transporter permease [Nitrospirota bacterium]
MRTFIYSLQTALKSLWHEKWINLLTVLSVGVGLLILSLFITISLNIDSSLKRWSKNFGLVVYLDEGLTGEAEETLKQFFLKDPDFSEVKYVSKEQALQELRRMLGTGISVLEGFEDNPLPSSFELTFKRKLPEPSFVRRKADQLRQMNGVDDVEYGEKWLSSLHTLSGVMRTGIIFLGGAIFIAVTFVTYGTVKILFYRRKDEVETLKLLGATRHFIRLPFLVEGIFIGILGGIISSAALYGLYSFIIYKGPQYLPSISAFIIPLPLSVYIPAPVAGAVMSLIGSFFAVGKIKY